MVFDLRKNNITKKPTSSKKQKRIVFMGSGSFALPLLQALMQNTPWDVVALVTKSPRKIGRGQSKNRTRAKDVLTEFAVLHHLPILQPEKFTSDVLEELTNLRADVFIVASYGKILPQAVLDIPPFHTINVHTSLLPELRGASPIHNAILQGKKQTGVTLMQMDAGLDTGPIIAQKPVPIDPTDTTPTLQKKLTTHASELLLTTLPQWFDQSITPQPQDPKRATLCQIISREDGHILWTETTQKIYNTYRAFIAWPGIFSLWKKSPTDLIRIKLIAIRPANLPENILSTVSPGAVFSHEKNIFVRSEDGALELLTLQRDGGKELPARDFVNGHPQIIGATLL